MNCSYYLDDISMANSTTVSECHRTVKSAKYGRQIRRAAWTVKENTYTISCKLQPMRAEEAVLVVVALVILSTWTEARFRKCRCNRLNRPVCGSDGNTYGDRCELMCQSRAGRTTLRIYVIHKGPCGVI